MSKTNLAIVGAGWWTAQTHIPAIRANPDAEVVALCDLDAERLKTTSEAFGITYTYTALDTMLEDGTINGVVVATNHASHYDVAWRCLESGFPVLIEKPMTLFARDAHRLVQLAAAKGLPLRIGYNHNYMPYTQRAREVFQAGQLGRVQYISGIFNQHVIGFLKGDPPPRDGMLISPGKVYTDPDRSGGGFGYLQLTHLVGMICYITGLKAQDVFALMHNHDLTVDLVNAVNIQFEGGALASIGGTGNMGAGGRKIDLQIYCEHGWIDIDEAEGTAVIQGTNIETEVYQLGGDWRARYPYTAPIDNFVDVLRGKTQTGVTGEVGWLAAEIIEAVYRSAGVGGSSVSIASLYDEALSP